MWKFGLWLKCNMNPEPVWRGRMVHEPGQPVPPALSSSALFLGSRKWAWMVGSLLLFRNRIEVCGSSGQFFRLQTLLREPWGTWLWEPIWEKLHRRVFQKVKGLGGLVGWSCTISPKCGGPPGWEGLGRRLAGSFLQGEPTPSWGRGLEAPWKFLPKCEGKPYSATTPYMGGGGSAGRL